VAVETDSDRTIFFDTGDFAIVATYAKASGGGAEITGIFLNPSINLSTFEEAAGIDRQPSFLCRESDVPSGAKGGDVGDTLTISATTYRVLNLRPDGTGMIQIDMGRSA